MQPKSDYVTQALKKANAFLEAKDNKYPPKTDAPIQFELDLHSFYAGIAVALRIIVEEYGKPDVAKGVQRQCGAWQDIYDAADPNDRPALLKIKPDSSE